MSLAAIIAALIAASAAALDPGAKLMHATQDALRHALAPTTQALTFPYVYVTATLAITAEGETVIAYKMPGHGIIGHIDKPLLGERYLLHSRANAPINTPFTKLRHTYSNGDVAIVEVQR